MTPRQPPSQLTDAEKLRRKFRRSRWHHRSDYGRAVFVEIGHLDIVIIGVRGSAIGVTRHGDVLSTVEAQSS
jgi:hypothetical protein